MSDEQAPPPPTLRLKPRLQPADAQPPAGLPSVEQLPSFTAAPTPVFTEVPAAPESAEPSAVPKIRFKPKLEANPSQPAVVSAEPASAPPGAPPLFTASIVPPSMANPHVIAPSPPLFATPPAPVTPPAPENATPPPALAPAADSGKFRLKPKSGAPVVPPPATDAGAAPFVFAPPPQPVAPPPVSSKAPWMVPPAAVPPQSPAPKAPPPFPVMAPPSAVKGVPPALPPTANPTAALAEPAPVVRVPERRKRTSSGLLKLVALLVLAGGGFVAWKKFKPATPAPAPAPAAKSAPAQKAPATPTSNPAPTPSDTLNQLAHAPKRAIDKAQDAINARRASGQSRVDAASVGEDLPENKAVAETSAAAAKQAAPRPKSVPTTTATVAPGVAATVKIEAAPEAAAPFRTFVANAKVSGVFQGPPTRAMINGRLTRAGETVDLTLGITFKGVDSERRQLIFQDQSGATVSRRF